MARPRKKIDQEQFEKLCALQCTQEEMCSFFDCDDKTLSAWCQRTYKKRFSEIFKIKRGTGRISLRRKQFEVALGGNVTMLVWLGKQWLGQAEKTETETKISASDNFISALNGTATADWENNDDTDTDV